MRLTWPNSGFITKELYAPFAVEKDSDYLSDLSKRYNILLEQAQKAEADEESIKIITQYKKKILEALSNYYKADIAQCNTIIESLIKDIGHDPLAVNTVNQSRAFPGTLGEEVQFFRGRIGNPSCSYAVKDMLHLPKSQRAKTGNYRFSIPGNPSFYLANSSYGCWIETGCPSDIEFNVAPIVLEGKQKIFNLAVSVRNFGLLNEFEKDRVHCWLKLLMLMIATSYRINEDKRTFKSEYIISQAVMISCKRMGYDGIAYFSRRVSDEAFALCAINLALFVDYDDEYSPLINHIKMDNPLNYFVFRQLSQSLKYGEYDLRAVNNPFITNIGDYDKQYPYGETEFFEFDKFLFASWDRRPSGKGKNESPWGVPIE